ncbi:hypothetical protein J5N97_011618 [Dioscorea zingiberensis]|uniref:XPG-I domain-containing protein n=1 Tax=Dioscorea zingiberensis TaxID=325984 RepID=A0A9D5D3E8_9LILI|nr:hypothetical protein J5N97_011618 [Dioscorea zingiberensis]
MDIVAGILGIEAEVAQNKGWHHKALFVQCRQPVHEAYSLGLAAAVLLAIAHATANLLGGCTCICSKEEFDRSSANRQMAAGTLIISWIILAVGFTMLIIQAMSNAKSSVSCGLTWEKPKFGEMSQLRPIPDLPRADAQLVYLSNLDADKGGIDAVITEDSDLIAYGCQAVIFKMDRYGKGEELLLDRVFNFVSDVLSFKNFDKEF